MWEASKCQMDGLQTRLGSTGLKLPSSTRHMSNRDIKRRCRRLVVGDGGGLRVSSEEVDMDGLEHEDTSVDIAFGLELDVWQGNIVRSGHRGGGIRRSL